MGLTVPIFILRGLRRADRRAPPIFDIFGARLTFPCFLKSFVFGVFWVCVILWCVLMNFDVDAAKVLGARRYGDITSFGM